jgi:hypothetical protein
VSWSYAWALRSKLGDGHPGDDAGMVRLDGDTLILAVADGAGSADLGGVGAKIACETFVEAVGARPLVQVGGKPINRLPDPGLEILAAVRERVLGEAASREVEPMALATTLIGAVLEPDRAYFFQIGDGAAVFRTFDDEFQTAIQPEETEFVNTTFFVTSPDVEAHLQTRWIPRRIEEVALFSDGLQPLVLHPTDQSPHDAFFGTVFRTLREAGEDEASKAWLQNMLASDMVTSRTDDDTSIVIARRLA